MNKNRLFLKGLSYGALASLLLWIVLSGTVLLLRRTEQDLYVLVVGIPLWVTIWTIVGLIVAAISIRRGRARSAGALCGIIVGVLSVVLMFAWPNCSYESVIDKTRWAIPYALLTPMLPILFLLNRLFQHVISGYLVDYAFSIISAATFWGVFGAMLGKLIGRGSSFQ